MGDPKSIGITPDLPMVPADAKDYDRKLNDALMAELRELRIAVAALAKNNISSAQITSEGAGANKQLGSSVVGLFIQDTFARNSGDHWAMVLSDGTTAIARQRAGTDKE